MTFKDLIILLVFFLKPVLKGEVVCPAAQLQGKVEHKSSCLGYCRDKKDFNVLTENGCPYCRCSCRLQTRVNGKNFPLLCVPFRKTLGIFLVVVEFLDFIVSQDSNLLLIHCLSLPLIGYQWRLHKSSTTYVLFTIWNC